MSSQRLGVNITRTTTVQESITLGAKFYDPATQAWYRYIKAGAAITKGDWVVATNGATPYSAVVKNPGASVNEVIIGLAQIAFASGDYGWIMTQGFFATYANITSAGVAPGDALQSNAASSAGQATIATAAALVNSCGVCMVDNADNTGSVIVTCA